MILSTRLRSFLAVFILGLGLLGTPLEPASGQTGGVVPTQEQIDAFKNLSPDQQDAILQQLGSGGGGTGSGLGSILGGGSGTSTTRSGQDLRQNQQNEQDQGQRADDGQQTQRGLLHGDDWVIVEIDFHLPPRPTPALTAQVLQSPQNLQAAQAAGVLPNSSQQPAAPQNPPAAPGNTADDQGLTESEKRDLNGLIDLIRRKNPYQLSSSGVLNLPGFAGIELMGLTEDQATLRLKVEPALQKLDVRITILPLQKTGPLALKPFGYDLFSRSPSTFAPVTNVPVPADYSVGAGDELNVQLYGTQNRTLRLVVGRDGRISFPELGPISVGGQLFSSVKSDIEARIEQRLIGVHGSVSMGDTRAIRVFVLGEARRPGSYTVSSLGTITSALFASGGVKTIGSLRRIQLKRQGEVVRPFDLYDLLLRGDTRDDVKLLQGDVIFIPPVGNTVSIYGEVQRPAVYEMKNELTVAEVVQLAGGLTSQADTRNAVITRIDESQHRVVIPVNLSAGDSKAQLLRNGDLLRVTRLRPTLDSGVQLEGRVYTPGNFAYHRGIHLSDVIHSVDDVQPGSDLHYILIRRESLPDRRISVLSADLTAALAAPGSKADVELAPRDRITVFDLASGRDRIIEPLLEELRLQANTARPTEVVHVDGRVKVPGDYPLETGMAIGDLVRAGGGLSDAAYGGHAELTRYEVVDGEIRRTELINIDLSAALHGDPKSNVLLKPFDHLSIKEVPLWQALEGVTLRGEVRFPGHYSIKRGETLRSVLARAGGLTEFAFPEGSVFTREELRKREQEQLDLLAERMQRDLTVVALEGAVGNQAGAGAALSVGQSLLGQLRAQKAVGRLVIDLPRMLKAAPGSSNDVILRDGDELIIPRTQQQVMVLGEVQNATSHLYAAGLTRDDYIDLSGGVTRRADRSRIYVVRANGSVYSHEGNRWFERSTVPINPGDTVVVPLDTERLPPLPFWTAVTTIIYNVAIAAAAVHSF